MLDLVNIGPDTDFFQAGGNSLLLVKLQALIRERLDVVVPLLELFEASKLRNMARKVTGFSSVIRIDWKTETAVADELVLGLPVSEKASLTASPKAGSGFIVLLTGATGFLGTHILRQLVTDERVSRIHCVSLLQSALHW